MEKRSDPVSIDSSDCSDTDDDDERERDMLSIMMSLMSMLSLIPPVAIQMSRTELKNMNDTGYSNCSRC